MGLCMEYQFDIGCECVCEYVSPVRPVVCAVVAIVIDRVRTLVRHVSKVKMCGRVWHCHRIVDGFFVLLRPRASTASKL